MKAVMEYFKKNNDAFLEDMKTFLAIPSISTSDEHKGDIMRAASFVEQQFTGMGLKNVQQYPTKGNPVVYGEWLVR